MILFAIGIFTGEMKGVYDAPESGPWQTQICRHIRCGCRGAAATITTHHGNAFVNRMHDRVTNRT
jgi:hypothetical protein